MKYYKLSNASNKKIIGKPGYPQCKGMPSGMKLTKEWFDRPESFSNINNIDFPDFEPDFIWELRDKAILTDVVSPSNISANGFLVSQKLKEILANFNLMEYRSYPAILLHKGKKLNYFWIHFKEDMEYYLSNVNYNASNFFIGNLAYVKEREIEINSYEEFIEEKRKLSFEYIIASKLVLKNELKNKELDLFYMRYFFMYYMVSNKLKTTIQEHKITGFEIKEQNIL